MGTKLLIGQSGGATAVINATLAGIVDEARASGKFDAIWGMRRGVEGALAGEVVDLSDLAADKLEAIAATPGAALGSSRHKLSDADADRLLDLFRQNRIHHLVYIGGNDSADTVHRLSLMSGDRGQSLCAIAAPKTIDNDLPITDHSPGYGSIARYAAIATMDSAKDTESMPTMYPIKLIEVMGRDAGWVAAATTLGKREPQDAPHLVYVPERRVSRDRVVDDIERVYSEHGRVVVVVAETLRDERGEPFAEPEVSGEQDAFGHQLVRGTADSICRLVQPRLGLRARFDKPGSLQRMSMLTASQVDAEEARDVGREAVRLAVAGETDRMVTIVRDGDQPYRAHLGSAPLEQIANRHKLLPDEFLRDDFTDSTPAFRCYAMPLLGDPDLPRYERLEAFGVKVDP